VTDQEEHDEHNGDSGLHAANDEEFRQAMGERLWQERTGLSGDQSLGDAPDKRPKRPSKL
jgi:hypothetical protein